MFKEFFTTPQIAIAKAKKKKDINYTLKILLIEWVLFSVGMFIISSVLLNVVSGAMLGISVFIIGAFTTLFIGWLIKVVMVTLGGKGKYFEGLTTCTLGMFPISIGFLVSVIISYIPLVGFILAFIALACFSALGIAMFYRGLKEMFGTDLITAWIGIAILVTSISLALYLSLLLCLSIMPEFSEVLPLTFQKTGYTILPLPTPT